MSFKPIEDVSEYGQPEPMIFHTPVKTPSQNHKKGSIIKNPFENTPYFQEELKYNTLTVGVPPLSIFRLKTNDQGSCNPKFVRSCFYHVPKTKKLLSQTGTSMGVVFTPFGKLDDSDIPSHVHVVDYKKSFAQDNQEKEEKTNGGLFSRFLSGTPKKTPEEEEEEKEKPPIRCKRCGAFLNPFSKFITGGKEYICNLCTYINRVPSWYFSHLDQNGCRIDTKDRPELTFGSCEIVVDGCKNYSFKENNKPLTYIIAIDISMKSKQQGIFQEVLKSFNQIFNDIAKKKSKSKLIFITYSESIHVFTIHNKKIKILCIGDPEVKLHEDSLITFSEFVENKDEFLKIITKMSNKIQERGNCLGNVLKFSQNMLAESGGKVIFFTSQLPNVGLGNIDKPRDHFELYGTNKEFLLFKADGKDKYYKTLSEDFSKLGISIDAFLFQETYSGFMETGIFAEICNKTNGKIFVFSKFNSKSDGEDLFNEISKCMLQEIGYDGILRVRTSLGLDIGKYYGHYNQKNEGEIDLCSITEGDTFAAEIIHDDTVEGLFSYIQVALLYTNCDGSRRVRVHNVRLSNTDDISTIFRFLDMESNLMLWTKMKCLNMSLDLQNFREWVGNKLVEVLAKYRKFCSTTSMNQAQLVLPDSLKHLPLFVLGLLKSPAFRLGTDIPIDQKIKDFFCLDSMPSRYFLNYLYPRLIPLHIFEKEPKYMLPKRLPLTAAKIDSNGLYLLDDGMSTTFFLGKDCSKTLVSVLWGKDSVEKIVPSLKISINTESEVGKRVSEILKLLKKDKFQNGKTLVLKYSDPQKGYFFQRFVLDKTAGQQSYYQHVIGIHGEIQNKVNF